MRRAPAEVGPKRLRVTTVKIRNEMGRLPARRRHFPSWDQSATQQALFIFAIEQNDAHDEVLHLPDEKLGFGLGRPLGGWKTLPGRPEVANLPQGLMEMGQEEACEAIDLVER